MCELGFALAKLSRRPWKAAAALLLVCVAPTNSRAQAAVEAAGAASASAGVTTAVTKAVEAPLPRPAGNAGPTFLTAREGPSPEETNRKSLEQHAGNDAAKVLLQSVPGAAVIYVDGMVVGRTPLLLILPPGKRQIEMRGQRQEFGQALLDLAPNETRRFTATLTSRYPASVVAHTTAPSVFKASTGVANAPTVSRPQPAASAASSAGEANRKALEQRAGKDGAKLILHSVPDGAMVYIGGMLVGRAPLQLIVAPGKYTVEMRGSRGEFGERLVGVLPNETQPLTLTLTSRYPANIKLR